MPRPCFDFLYCLIFILQLIFAERIAVPAIDLQHYLSECELNYVRLLRLSPVDLTESVTAGRFLEFALENHHARYAECSMRISEQRTFTTMLSLCFTFSASPQFLSQALQSFTALEFELRLYHDAHVLEIMSFQGRQRVQPSYVYPNKHMHQPDEKLQQQNLLRVCLQQALKDALTLDAPWQPCD